MSAVSRLLDVAGVQVEIVRKDVKHLRLAVLAPDGRVRASVPRRMREADVRAFVEAKRGWIHDKQRVCIEHAQVRNPEPIPGATLWVWGQPRTLRIDWIAPGAPRGSVPSVRLEDPGVIVLRIAPSATVHERRSLLDAWSREALEAIVPALLSEWERMLGVRVAGWTVRRMKTRWGSCSPHRGTIRLGLELATRPIACAEYVLVHEMVHLLEPSHGPRFYRLMDRFLPDWRERRDTLERVPVMAP